MLAPIVLFVYNRPLHTRRTLEALSANKLAQDSTLYVYADGAKQNADEQTINNIHETRKIIKQKQWCGKVHIIEKNVNKGLVNSIVEGVTEIMNKHEKVIVLEDDLVTSPGFLEYMNEALHLYEHEEKVMEVCAYFYPIKTRHLPDTFFYNINSCWGWGTWKRAWHFYEHDINKLYTNVINSFFFNQKDFNKGHNNDVFRDFTLNYENKLHTWAVRWHASIYLQQGFCLHPKLSLVRNIGHDQSGIYCGTDEKLQNQPIAKEIPVKKIGLIQENKKAIFLNQAYFKKQAAKNLPRVSLIKRAASAIKKIARKKFKLISSLK